MQWMVILALALDLGTVKTEPKLEKRSELALQYANSALDSAKSAYQEGRFEQTQSALGQVKDAVTLSLRFAAGDRQESAQVWSL